MTSGPPGRPLAYSYVRMSSAAQLKGHSLRRQMELSQKYAEEHGLELLDGNRLHDLGISAFRGANVASGALGQFLAAVKDGKVPEGSFLLVESLDRISRQQPIASLQIF